MSTTAIFHLTFSFLAIFFGAWVLMIPKGTRGHRTIGHGYLWCMVGVIATSFAMYTLTGRFTPFHIAAIFAAITVVIGMYAVLRRRPKKRWILNHATWMAGSYVGLCAALVAETLTRFVYPKLATALESNSLIPAFWTLVLVGSMSTIAIGVWLIRKNIDLAVSKTPAAMRNERKTDPQ